MLTAYCTVPAENEPGDAEAIAAIMAAAGSGDQHEPAATNPWAKVAP